MLAHRLARRGDGGDGDGGGDQRLAGVELVVMDVQRVILVGEAARLAGERGGFGRVFGGVGAEAG